MNDGVANFIICPEDEFTVVWDANGFVHEVLKQNKKMKRVAIKTHTYYIQRYSCRYV